MAETTPEERARKLVSIAVQYWELDDPEFEDNYALDIASEMEAAVDQEREANCRAVCEYCRLPGQPGKMNANGVHDLGHQVWGGSPFRECQAAAIRARGKTEEERNG